MTSYAPDSPRNVSFADETVALMPPPRELPAEFRALFDWIEGNGWIGTYSDGWAGAQSRFVTLHEPGQHLGSGVEFRVLLAIGGVAVAAPWHGSEQPGTADRILPFARIGGDGSEVAFWIDDQAASASSSSARARGRSSPAS